MNAFWQGFFSAFTFSVPLRRPKPLTIDEAMRADRKAMAGDWKRVGDDMRQAISTVRRGPNP
jgi:hypothetical protein